MDLIHEWLVLIVFMAVALVSPGPDFIMAVRNSIVYSRRAGLFTALGFSAAVSVHVAYCMIGIAAVISQSILLFSTIKYAGAAYLIYIGIKSLRSKGFGKTDIQIEKTPQKTEEKTMSDFAALRSGFITNLFNPKATLFFLALFTQVVDPHTTAPVQALYGLTCMAMTAGWFSIVATVLTHKALRAQFLRFTQWIDRICGALLIALGVKLIISRA